MPVAVNQPRAKEKEADPLDTIIKGLSIASSIYGIKDASDKKALLEKDYASKQAQQEQDNAFKTRELDIKEKDANKPKVQDPTQTEFKQIRLEEAKRKAQADAEKAAFDKTPDGRIAKLTGDKVKRFDEAKMGFDAVNKMASALDAGDNTFSLIGDNDYTMNANLFKEAIGRMQSGGAIGTKEAKEFLALAPGAMDSPEIQRAKLLKLQSEFGSRIQSLGFKPEELGLSKTEFKYGLNSNKPSGGGVNSTLVGGLKEGIAGMSTANASAQPKTIIQGGHTYTLNPATGKYE